MTEAYKSKERYAMLSKTGALVFTKQVYDRLGSFDFDVLVIEDEKALEAALKDETYKGFLVVEPYKEVVLKYLDELSESAEKVAAVTTVKRLEDGRLKGYNPDIDSFRFLVPHDIKGWKAVILGTGSAARTAVIALKELGADPVLLVSRHPEAASADFRAKYDVISYNQLKNHKDARIMVNATSIGMYPNNCKSPLDGKLIKASAFRKLELAIDLIHNPSRTKFLQDAERCSGNDNKLVVQRMFDNLGERVRGYRHAEFSKVLRDSFHSSSRVYTHSGMDMLVRQLLFSKEIWLDEKPYSVGTEQIEAIKRELLVNQLNLILVGMPGSGKSSIAKMIARELNRTFIDVDKETETLMGEKIEDVLVDESKGEAYMREYETEALRMCCRQKGCVIATGGGAVLRPVNRDLIRENACVVYIRRPLTQLSLKNRPLSQNRGVDTLYKERAGLYYRVADVVVTNSHTFGESYDKNGSKNSYTYDLKRFAYKVIHAAFDRLDDMIAMHSYKYETADKKRQKK